MRIKYKQLLVDWATVFLAATAFLTPFMVWWVGMEPNEYKRWLWMNFWTAPWVGPILGMILRRVSLEE